MKWRLGLDLGTNSIGWAVLKLHSGHPEELVDMGVRIFSNGRENAAENRVGAPLNESRRLARQMRRQRDRKIRRKKSMLNYLISVGYFPKDALARKGIALLDPYELRNKALQERLNNQELGRILMQFSSRRGFKSSRKENPDNPSSDSEHKAMYKGIDQLRKELNGGTLGQWLWEHRQRGESIRFRPIMTKSSATYSFYPDRAMYEEEFARIKKFQEPFHTDINWDRLHWLIFFQRPLKRPERGHCQFYEEEYRAYKAEPSAQRFRILQDINNLKYYDPDIGWVDIPNEIKSHLFQLLDSQKSISFNKLRNEFGEEFTFKFNLENEKRKDLTGNITSCEMRKPDYFGKQWDTLSWQEQDNIIEFLLSEDDIEKISDFLRKYNLNKEQIEKISGSNLATGTTMLSSHFMRDCSQIMIEKNIRYDAAVVELGLHHSITKQLEHRRYLPYYGQVLSFYVMPIRKGQNANLNEEKYGRIPNPTVHIALNQTKKVINALIRRFGHPEEIIVEVGREIKLSDKVKSTIFKIQTKNQEENERINKIIKEEHGIINSRDYIKKYKLWEELAPTGLSRRCPYCGKPISATQLFSSDVEIEHILPYSKTLLDSYDNLTVAHRSCNQFKGDRSPYEAFGSSPAGYNWAMIVELSQNLPRKKQYKFSPKALDQYINDGPGFLTSQATDNAYISKAVKDYLAVICDRNSIWVTTGSLTYLLRGKWGINTLLNANHDTWFKNRTDHRHHALDALVIGLCDRNIISEAARVNAGHDYGSLLAPECPIPRTEIDEKLRRIMVSLKPNHKKEGKLFAETALGESPVFERIPSAALKKEDIELLIPVRIKNYVKEFVKKEGFAKAIEELSKNYQYFMVKRNRWITRAPLISLSNRDIENICDLSLRQNIIDFIKDISDKTTLKEALQKFSEEHSIYSVRYAPKDQVPYRIRSCTNKAYMPADYYRVDIWRIPDNKGHYSYQGDFLSRVQVLEESSKKGTKVKKPHDAAKKIMSLYKGDIIELSHADFKVFCRIASYSTTQNKIDIQPLESADSISSWREKTKGDLINPYWHENISGHNYKSINAIFNTFMVRLVFISPDGKMSYME